MDIMEFAVKLIDGMSDPAKQAANSVSNLTDQMKLAKTDLSNYQKQLSLSKDVGDVAGYRKYSAAVAHTKQQLFLLGEQTSSVMPGVASVAPALGALAGPLAALGTAYSATAAAAAAFAVAVGLATYQAASFAVEASANKSAMLASFDALLGGADAARQMDDALDGLSDALGVTGDRLEPMARKYIAMGVDGTDAVQKLIRANLSAQAIMQDPAAGAAFDSLTTKIRIASQTGEGLKIPAKGLGSLSDAGLKVDDVASRMGLSAHALSQQLQLGTANAVKFGDAMQEALIEKGAGPLAAQASKVGNIFDMFKQNVEKMFEDMSGRIEPVLVQFRSLNTIFEESSPSAQAMKAAITGALGQVFDATAGIVPMVRHAFLDFIIYSLEAYIAIKEHWGAVKVFMHSVLAPFEAVYAVMSKIAAINFGLVKAGYNVAAGFASGISSGIDKVKAASADMGNSAYDGTAGALDMHSPSRRMFMGGMNFDKGMAMGIDAGIPVVERSADSLGDSAARSTWTASYSTANTSQQTSNDNSTSKSVTIGSVTIQLQGNASDAMSLTEAAVVSLFERIAIQQGLGEANG